MWLILKPSYFLKVVIVLSRKNKPHLTLLESFKFNKPPIWSNIVNKFANGHVEHASTSHCLPYSHANV